MKSSPQTCLPRTAVRPGFTMVEILVVVVIIAMLAGLTVAVALPAITRGKETRIKLEIDQLDAALKAYKNQFGAYPPSNMANEAEVRRHINKAFPQNVETSLGTANGISWSDYHRDYLAHLSPAQALVFWLSGFSPNPEYPLTGPGDRKPLYGFDQSRLVPVSSTSLLIVPAYVPQDGEGAPYVYFRAGSYSYDLTPAQTNNSDYGPVALDFNSVHGLDAGIARPYPTAVGARQANTPAPSLQRDIDWANPDSFQIISAGLDGEFGFGGIFPSGLPYIYGQYPGSERSGYNTSPTADVDNLTNFSEKTLRDALPE